MTVLDYREKLRSFKEWDRFLIENSGLPGKRGNIELGKAVAEEGDQKLFLRYLTFVEKIAPANTPQEFFAFCGILGLGRLLSEGQYEFLPIIKTHASDNRWRTREAVAMALQRWGEKDIVRLLNEMESWSRGNLFEKRAAAAALCEPILLTEIAVVEGVLKILQQITSSLLEVVNRKAEAFRVLKKGLGYCWSIAIAAYPEKGKQYFESWLNCPDADIRWILKENLKKNRLKRMDAFWVEEMKKQLP
jgi:hypothetical protein